MRALPSVALLSLGACEPAPADSAVGAETAETAETADTGAPMEPLFAFAVLADPHLTTGIENQERLAAAVAWVNQEALDRQIELVFVVGDIGWHGGLEVGKALLDQLQVPYAPVIGDNEIHFGDEITFDEVFTPQYELLASTLEEWRRGAVEVYNPELGQSVWLQNYSFSYAGLRFVGLDWCSRDPGTLASEIAEANDLDGGTLPFLEEELTTLVDGPEEDVLLFSHHPMMWFPGGFLEDDWAKITGVTAPMGHRVAGAYAGHLHVNHEEAVEEAGYDLFITDATFDDELTVRVVTVASDGVRHRYTQEVVVVP